MLPLGQNVGKSVPIRYSNYGYFVKTIPARSILRANAFTNGTETVVSVRYAEAYLILKKTKTEEKHLCICLNTLQSVWD